MIKIGTQTVLRCYLNLGVVRWKYCAVLNTWRRQNSFDIKELMWKRICTCRALRCRKYYFSSLMVSSLLWSFPLILFCIFDGKISLYWGSLLWRMSSVLRQFFVELMQWLEYQFFSRSQANNNQLREVASVWGINFFELSPFDAGFLYSLAYTLNLVWTFPCLIILHVASDRHNIFQRYQGVTNHTCVDPC